MSLILPQPSCPPAETDKSVTYHFSRLYLAGYVVKNGLWCWCQDMQSGV